MSDRLEDVEYLDNVNDTESFDMDDLGNRDGSQTLRSGTVSYAVDDDTNRYNVNRCPANVAGCIGYLIAGRVKLVLTSTCNLMLSWPANHFQDSEVQHLI